MAHPSNRARGGNATMPIHTKRWCDKRTKSDGYRLLVCRYRPRGVRKEDETWDGWCTELAPSKQLHADYYGKKGPPISWEEYRERFLEEMKAQTELLDELAQLVAEGKTITLLCSSACTDETLCHRTLLRELIQAHAERLADQGKSE